MQDVLEMTAPGRRATSAEKQDPDRRARILDVARHLFGTRGFERVGLDDIAKAAGVSLRAFYAEFSGKEELLHTVLTAGNPEPPQDDGVSTLDDVVEAVLGSVDRPVQTSALGAAYLRAVRANPEYELQLRASIRGVRAIIERCVRGGTRGVSADEAATAVVGLLTDARSYAAQYPGALPRHVVHVMVHRLLGQDERVRAVDDLPASRPVALAVEDAATPRTGRERAQLETRKRLLDAAESLLVRDGLANVSLARVADLAGYSVGAVYSNFANKQALLSAVDARDARRRIARLTPPADAPPREQLLQIFETLAHAYDTNLGLELGALRAYYPELTANHGDFLTHQRAMLREVLRAAYADRSLEPPAPVATLTDAVFATRNGCWFMGMLDPGLVDDALIVRAMHRLVGGEVLADAGNAHGHVRPSSGSGVRHPA